jgi:hypothetical protein
MVKRESQKSTSANYFGTEGVDNYHTYRLFLTETQLLDMKM